MRIISGSNVNFSRNYAVGALVREGVEGWFLPEEGAWYAAQAARGGVVVEVGCWKGLSASYAGPACRDAGGTFWAVDAWSGSTDEFHPKYAETLAREDVRAIFEQNMRALGVAARILALPSVEAASRFSDASCDFVFLDASHDEASVAADLAAWSPKVRSGGLLAGHDLCDRTPGVERALRAFLRDTPSRLERGPGRLWSIGPFSPVP